MNIDKIIWTQEYVVIFQNTVDSELQIDSFICNFRDI